MAEANKDVEKDFILATLITQVDELAKRLIEMEVQFKKNKRKITCFLTREDDQRIKRADVLKKFFKQFSKRSMS